MLVAPDFLFRVETQQREAAQAGRACSSTPIRSATRLSFFLWDSAPDSELLAAAQSRQADDGRGLQQQVERLLSSPRLEERLRAFFIDMLAFGGIDEDPGFETLSIDTSFYPNFTPNVRRTMRRSRRCAPSSISCCTRMPTIVSCS